MFLFFIMDIILVVSIALEVRMATHMFSNNKFAQFTINLFIKPIFDDINEVKARQYWRRQVDIVTKCDALVVPASVRTSSSND